MNKKKNRIGEERINQQGIKMTVVEYINAQNMIIEFDDESKSRIGCAWKEFNKGKVLNPFIKDGSHISNKTKKEIRNNYHGINKQGCKFHVIDYKNASNVFIEFEDKYHSTIKSTWRNVERGVIENPYFPTIYGVGIVGNKYKRTDLNGNKTKEFKTWCSILERCYKSNLCINPTYMDCEICNEWILYENFYEWIIKQKNYDIWKTMPRSAIDKDILVKNNKIYSPKTCCLVPDNVNILFIKNNASRGDCPIGVFWDNTFLTYVAECSNQFNGKRNVTIGKYDNKLEAFYAYKKYKEKLIKEVAIHEYKNNTITEECYNAMIKYEVEITD